MVQGPCKGNRRSVRVKEPIGIGKGSLALPVPCQQFQRMPALLRIFVNRLQLIYHERASGAAGW